MKMSKKAFLGLMVSVNISNISVKTRKNKSNNSLNLSSKISRTATISNGINISSDSETDVIIKDFQINIKEVTFTTKTDASGNISDSKVLDHLFYDPFQLDLVDEDESVTETIGTSLCPNEKNTELVYKIHKKYNYPIDRILFGRSVSLKGHIDGQYFEVNNESIENVDIVKAANDNENIGLAIQFTINKALNAIISVGMSGKKNREDEENAYQKKCMKDLLTQTVVRSLN